MIEQDNTEHEINEYDSPILKAIHHVDDGCCYMAPYLYDLNFRRYIHDGVCMPRPKPKQVSEPKLTPRMNKKKKKARKVNDEQN